MRHPTPMPPLVRTAVVALLLAAGCDRRPTVAPGTGPPAPDYAAAASWAALPDRADAADVTPPGALDRQHEAVADVFYLHPTTLSEGERWNADPFDPELAAWTERTALRNQASAFNGAGRVFAPWYRQAAIGSYFGDREESLAARELAYGDVERAFDHYLAAYNDGRPFVLAGHSQGADHLLRLLERRLSTSPAAGRLVAAYLIGMPIPTDKFDGSLARFPPCDGPEETGCVVSWNAVSPRGSRRWYRRLRHHEGDGWRRNEDRQLLCTHPFSWRVGGDAAEPPIARSAVPPTLDGALPRVAGPPGAACVGGLLQIDRPADPRLRPRRGGNYHAFDVALFYFDLRANVERRVRSFVDRRR